MDVLAAPSKSATKGKAPWRRPSLLGAAVIIVIFVLLLAAFGVGIYGLSASRRLNLADPQSWLPPQQLEHPVERTLVGTVSKPALTVEGDYVEVHTPTFSALALVAGPNNVPAEGLPSQAADTTCTWTVSLSHVVGRVPISVRDFDSIDHDETVYEPHLIPGDPQPPATLRTGQRLTFQMRAVIPSGEGLLRWAPGGDHIVAKWDYEVDSD